MQWAQTGNWLSDLFGASTPSRLAEIRVAKLDTNRPLYTWRGQVDIRPVIANPVHTAPASRTTPVTPLHLSPQRAQALGGEEQQGGGRRAAGYHYQ
jgi:hypothetical protein